MVKFDIELVVHCWSGDEVPIYHKLLQCQLSSLLLSPPPLKTRYTLFVSKDDQRTSKVLDDFIPIFRKISYVDLNIRFLDLAHLFRRSVGRDRAAKESESEVIWFTDVDYYFGDEALSAAFDLCVTSSTVMVYPKTVMVNVDHKTGDKLIESVEPGRIVMIEPSDFEPTDYAMAIGGIQIVKGKYCRKNGYASKSIGRKPVNLSDDDGVRFRKCRGDAAFRKMVNGDITPVEIPNVYRIRHSRAGRDGGKVDHGAQK